MKDFLIWFLYNVLFAVGYFLLLPKFLLRMWRRGGYGPGFMQRFGIYDTAVLRRLGERRQVWIHAVSVGEVFVALRFIETMRASMPAVGFVLSTTTSTGHAEAEKRLADDDVLLYFPVDFPLIVRRVVRLLNPVALLLTECELWPNLLRSLHRKGVPVFVINGRISESSFRGYSKLKPFFRRAAAMLNRLYVQSDVDRERLVELGAQAEKIDVMGSAKYDLVPSDGDGREIASQILSDAGMDPDAPLFVAGSTWPGEEELLLDIFARLHSHTPALQMILVPRHMERRDEVEAVLKAGGLSYIKRSEMQPETKSREPESGNGERPCVLLADTTGELKHYYSIGTLIFVGKSLGDNRGGQNPIEPAMFGKPIVVGSHMENFPGVIEDFLKADALIQVADAGQLETELVRLLEDAELCRQYGDRAGRLVAEKRGVVARTVESIREQL